MWVNIYAGRLGNKGINGGLTEIYRLVFYARDCDNRSRRTRFSPPVFFPSLNRINPRCARLNLPDQTLSPFRLVSAPLFIVSKHTLQLPQETRPVIKFPDQLIDLGDLVTDCPPILLMIIPLRIELLNIPTLLFDPGEIF